MARIDLQPVPYLVVADHPEPRYIASCEVCLWRSAPSLFRAHVEHEHAEHEHAEHGGPPPAPDAQLFARACIEGWAS